MTATATAPASGAHAELARLLGDRFRTSADERAQHGRDESYHAPQLPDAVAHPTTADEVQAIARICAAHGVPMIPFGAGTSVEGHVLATRGGVSIDLRGMNRVLQINAEDMDVEVEPGVTRVQLARALRDSGLMFPIDPGADASLGGMTATRASGTTAVRYGTMQQNVLALDVVLADGTGIHTGSRARKSSAGYDLTRLFVGSEGTLGIITRLWLRLHPVPESIVAAVCSFPSMQGAVDTVIGVMQAGIRVARVELLDELTMDAVRRFSGLADPIAPTIFFELHGTSAETASDVEQIRQLATANGGDRFRVATSTQDRDALWKARHDVYPASLALRPGSRGLTTDVCVPVSRLTECILETKDELASSKVPVLMVGHVGDGNFHLIFLIDPNDPSELAQARASNDRVVERALRMGGTCTGEHGVGLGKMKFMAREHGAALGAMRAIKHALDPRDLMNPGKVLPAE